MGAGKNFLWYSIGFVSAAALAAGGVAIAVCAIPSSAYLGDNVSGEAAKASILQLLMHAQDYTVDEFPIIEKVLNEAVANYQLDQYVSIDYDQLRGKKFSEIDFSSLLGSAVKITASIDSLGLSSELGSFANLHIMTNWDAVPQEDIPSSNPSNPYLYYYQVDGKYTRAYLDDGTPNPSYSNQTLFYPALSSIPLLDIGQVFEVRLGQQEAKEALVCFGMPSDSPLFSIVHDKTFSELESIDVESILLNDILPYSEQPNLYDTILPILNDGISDESKKLTYDTVKISDLESIDMDSIHLKTVVNGLDSSTQEILAEGCSKASFEDITVQDLSSFDMNKIRLSKVLGDVDPTLKSILLDITHKQEGDWDSLTLSVLQGSMDMDAIRLSLVLDTSSDLYSILQDGLSSSSGELTIGDLSAFDIGNVHLSKIIPSKGNEKLYGILGDMLNSKEADSITIGDLQNGLDTNKIKLRTVMGYEEGSSTENAVLDTLLAKDPSVGEIEDTFASLTVHETFATKVFTQDSASSLRPSDTYDFNEEDGSYTYNASGKGTYYISNKAGIWLVLGYEPTTNADTGRGTKYEKSPLTVAELSGNTGNGKIKNAINHTSLYQLISAGIIDDSGFNAKLQAMTVSDILVLASLYVK